MTAFGHRYVYEENKSNITNNIVKLELFEVSCLIGENVPRIWKEIQYCGDIVVLGMVWIRNIWQLKFIRWEGGEGFYTGLYTACSEFKAFLLVCEVMCSLFRHKIKNYEISMWKKYLECRQNVYSWKLNVFSCHKKINWFQTWRKQKQWRPEICAHLATPV